MAVVFQFMDSLPPDSEHREFVLHVPPRIGSKAELLAVFASAGRFPDYFGSNWDALLDCLLDLSWIGARNVIIVHSDIPLQGAPSERRAYLEILQTAATVWSEAVETNRTPSAGPYVEHELRVVFPISARASVCQIMEDEGSGMAGESRRARS